MNRKILSLMTFGLCMCIQNSCYAIPGAQVLRNLPADPNSWDSTSTPEKSRVFDSKHPIASNGFQQREICVNECFQYIKRQGYSLTEFATIDSIEKKLSTDQIIMLTAKYLDSVIRSCLLESPEMKVEVLKRYRDINEIAPLFVTLSYYMSKMGDVELNYLSKIPWSNMSGIMNEILQNPDNTARYFGAIWENSETLFFILIEKGYDFRNETTLEEIWAKISGLERETLQNYLDDMFTECFYIASDLDAVARNYPRSPRIFQSTDVDAQLGQFLPQIADATTRIQDHPDYSTNFERLKSQFKLFISPMLEFATTDEKFHLELISLIAPIAYDDVFYGSHADREYRDKNLCYIASVLTEITKQKLFEGTKEDFMDILSTVLLLRAATDVEIFNDLLFDLKYLLWKNKILEKYCEDIREKITVEAQSE